MDFVNQPTCSEQAKVKQKDRDAPTGKSVVVLKSSDVSIGRSGAVLMPNTIEMAQLKKPEKGQFKTVQFSRKMTKMDIERILVEIFPFLEHQRFYCAAAVDNRTRLDFHGEPGIWDGQFIKRKIKGNSALYIFIEEEKSGDTQDSTLPAQSTPKRTHDQITTQENEKSEQPSKKKPGCKGATTVPVGDAITLTAQHIPDISADARKSGVLSVTNMVTQEKVSSMLTPQMDKLKISSASSTTAEQIDQHFQQTPAGLQHGVGIRGSCHHSKQSPDKKNNSGVAQATGRHQDVRKAPVSDHESESEGQGASNSSTSDSGYDGETGLFATAKPEDSSLANIFPEIPQCEDMQDDITPELAQVVLKVLHNPSSSDSAFDGEKDTFCSAEDIFCSLQNLQDPISKITSKTNFSEALSKIASSQGLIISDNQGSGNCMFYALSEQLAAMKGIHISHEDLRQHIVQYLKMNPRLPDGTELFKFIAGYPSWADYLRNMSADGTWGDHLTLFAAANCFKTSIRVVSSLSRDHDVTISLECGDDSGNVLTLGHVSQNHYVSLLPMPEVESIAPKRGPLKGGYNFTAVLHKELPENFLSGKAEFEGVATVDVQKSSPFSLSGIVPCSLLAGDVNVIFKDQTGTQCIAKAVFCYVDNMWELVMEIVVDPEKQAVFFAKLSQGYGLLACNSNSTQVKCLGNLQHQGQTKQQQSLNVLLQVFYIAAERGAQQFIEMIFSTSAGQIVFNSYKDRTPLPEDVAKANGHEDLAQYLQDVNTRLSKEISSDVTSCAIDWLELVEAAQNQAAVAQDQQLKHFCESDDNSSEYFADAETSSCGSFDLDDVYDTDSDSEESTEKEPCTTNGVSEHGPSKRPGTGEEGCSNKVTVEQEERPDSTSDRFRREDTSAVHAAHYSSGGRTTEPRGLNKVAKWEDNFPMQQSASLDKKDKTESFILIDSPPIAYVFHGADVQSASETSAAKPKEDVNTTVEFVSERNPSPKDIFVNNHSKPDTKDLHVECERMKNQHCEDLCIESECMHRFCPLKSGMTTVPGSSTFNKELSLGDLPMEDASMEELHMERLKFWYTKDFEAGKISSIEPCTDDAMSNQGPNKRPFTCKEVPSNSVEEVEPADNKEDKEVSRLQQVKEFEMEISEMLARVKEETRTLYLETLRCAVKIFQDALEMSICGKDGRADKILEDQHPAQSNPKLARETSIYGDERSPKVSRRVTTIIRKKSTQKKNCEKLTRHIPYHSAQNLINSGMPVFEKTFVDIGEAHELLLVEEMPGYYRSLEGFRSKGKLTLKRFTNHLSTNDVLDHLSKASIDDVDDVEDQRGSGLSNAKEQALELCQETFMQSKKVKFIGDCTNFAFEDYEVKLIQPEMLQEDQFLLFQSKKGKFIGECTNFYCEDHEVIRSQPEITQEVFIAQHGQNVDDAVIIGLLRNSSPDNVNENGNDNDDNLSHTFTRATRNLIGQPAFKRSIIINKLDDSISDPGFAVCSYSLLKDVDSCLSDVGQATSALYVLIHDGDDNVTGYVLPNVKEEEVLELLGKILMPNRNVTLVMASGESSSQRSVMFVSNVTKRQELDH